jgi:hypothetical protein
MTFSAHGIDGVLLVLAALAFLAAIFAHWTGHKAAHSLVALGLLFWVLTALVS